MIEVIAFLLGSIISVAIGTVLFYAGATFSCVEGVSVKKAGMVSVMATIVVLALSWFPIVGIIIIFLVVMILVRLVFLTTWTTAFVIAVIYVIVSWIINNFLFFLLI
jgi:hypothetical protein